MGKMKDLQLQVQWIGEDATVARQALAQGDTATVASCLSAIQCYARGLGYVATTPDQEEEADGACAQHE